MSAQAEGCRRPGNSVLKTNSAPTGRLYANVLHRKRLGPPRCGWRVANVAILPGPMARADIGLPRCGVGISESDTLSQILRIV